MILQINLAAIIAVASQTVWRKAKPIIFQDTFLFPALGCLGIILLWWVVALANHELMPTPPEALIANWDYILHPFYQRGPGDLGIGWLLLASLRRVILGFGLGALVAIPLGFLIGMSRPAMLAFNPIIVALNNKPNTGTASWLKHLKTCPSRQGYSPSCSCTLSIFAIASIR